MKNIVITMLFIALSLLSAKAQRVVWQDDFESSKGWTEYEEKKDNFMVVKNGVMDMKSSDENPVITKCKTNYDCNKNFTLSVEAIPKSGLKEGMLLGILVDYRDTKNWIFFGIEKGTAVFWEMEKGNLIREDSEPIKKIKKDKKTTYTLEIRRKGSNVMFVINDEETIEMDDIQIRSNKVGLIVTGDQEVLFDNIKISQ